MKSDDRPPPDQLDKALEVLHGHLKDLNEGLADLNSQFPAMRAFLERCGVTNVKELSPAQMIELKAYLQSKLEDIRARDSAN